MLMAVSRSVEGHLLSALRNNFRHFFALDTINRNGQVEWNEWLKSFNEVSISSSPSTKD